MKNKRKLTLFKNLVIDITDFVHPGYNAILNNHINQDIYYSYLIRKHSINADLILCQRTVAKL